MQQHYRTYLSFFLLFLFLFPKIEKGIHDLEHSNDFHCAVKNEKHFHKQEHSCAICEFMPGLSATTAHDQESFIPAVCSFHYPFVSSPAIILEPAYYLPLRAPPASAFWIK